ncbi:hypothetical protein DFJ74DRAFT_291814 [Hyaloraphidium curvatum]|nr:hypothetical protein DFJ74DRAFT_291814 [Hyaloraphidium curvatum]
MDESTLPLPSDAAVFELIHRTLASHAACFLITHGGLGASPSARLVGLLPVRGTLAAKTESGRHPGDPLVLEITTNASTRKFAELRADPRVTFAVFRPDATTQVVCKGVLERMLTEPEELKAYWKDRYASMYTSVGWKPGDDAAFEHRFVVLQFRVTVIEVMSLGEQVADHLLG